MRNILDRLNKFFGVVIALNIMHQIASSAGYLVMDMPLIKTLYLISLTIFGIELIARILVERRLSFLFSIDGLVLINQVFFSIYDLRMLRLFRLFDIFIIINNFIKFTFTDKLTFIKLKNNITIFDCI